MPFMLPWRRPFQTPWGTHSGAPAAVLTIVYRLYTTKAVSLHASRDHSLRCVLAAAVRASAGGQSFSLKALLARPPVIYAVDDGTQLLEAVCHTISLSECIVRRGTLTWPLFVLLIIA